MLRKVHLYGEARERFGEVFTLDVDTLAEACHAIYSQIPEFRTFLIENRFRCVRGDDLDNGMDLGEEQILFKLGRADLHIVPVIEGEGGGKAGSVGKIIGGLLLAGVAFWAAPAMGATLLGGAFTYGNLVTLGIGIAAMGVSQMLSAQPEKGKDAKDESFGFNNSLSPMAQGGVVKLIFGRNYVRNPDLISAAIEASDIAIGR